MQPVRIQLDTGHVYDGNGAQSHRNGDDRPEPHTDLRCQLKVLNLRPRSPAQTFAKTLSSASATFLTAPNSSETSLSSTT